jgi:hypothetical protein
LQAQIGKLAHEQGRIEETKQILDFPFPTDEWHVINDPPYLHLPKRGGFPIKDTRLEDQTIYETQ